MSIFKNWTDEHSKKFQNDTICVDHKLEQTGLFSDDALIALLDKHPASQLDVCTMGQHAQFKDHFRTGDFRGCDGKTLLEAVKAGRLWINVRRAMNVHPEYNKLLQEIYGELAVNTGNKEFNARGGILISSPIAKVPYHTDSTHTILWHIRGTKKLYIYPMAQEFMSDDAYEQVITNTILDDVPYEQAYDKHAHILTLTGGEMASWQLNQPHRVVNETFCVSVTTEYSTRASAFKNSAMFAQAAMRSKFGAKPIWDETPMAGKIAKSMFGKVLQKSGLYNTQNKEDFVTFKIDKSVPGYITDIEPMLRDF